MAQITAAQVQELERKNRELEEKIRKIESEMTKASNAKLEEYRAMFRKQLQENNAKKKSEYESRLAELKLEMQVHLENQEIAQLEEYDRLRKEVLKVREESENKQAELRKELDNIKNEANQKEAQQEESAENQFELVKAQMDAVSELPCDSFFPGKLSLHKNSLSDIGSLIKNKMYQAAIAAAVSAKAALSFLKYDVTSQKELWERQYQIFENGVSRLADAQREWVSNWIAYMREQDNPDEKAAIVDLLFWTEDKYREILDKIVEWETIILRVNEVGTDRFLKENSALSIDKLLEYNNIIDGLSLKQEVLFGLHESSLNASIDREDWSEKIISFMTEEKGFDYEKNSSGWDDFSACQARMQYVKDYNEQYECKNKEVRGLMQVNFTRNDGLRVEIAIIPSLGENNQVTNIIRFQIFKDDSESVEMTYIKEILSAIQLLVSEDGSIVDIETTNNRNVATQMAYSENSYCREWVRKVDEEKERIRREL